MNQTQIVGNINEGIVANREVQRQKLGLIKIRVIDSLRVESVDWSSFMSKQ